MNWRTRLFVAVTIGSATLLTAAACSGTDSPATSGASSGTALASYVNCLKEHGVDTAGMPTARPSGARSGQPRPAGSARPSGFPSAFPSGFPAGRPSGMPSRDASARPGGRPDGGFGLRPSGVDEATWQQAQNACRSLLPTGRPDGAPDGVPGGIPGGVPGGIPGGAPSASASAGAGGGQGSGAAYANCLADHGVQLSAGLDSNDPKVAAALQACVVLSPSPTAK